MAKDNGYPTYVGWFQPHPSIDEDNRVLDRKTGELVELPSMTKQSFVAECDINNIIREFQVTGQVAHINRQAAQGAYLELPDELDFQQSLDLVKKAETAFATLPAKVRAELGNDPAAFLAYVADPANHDRLVEWGLAKPAETPPPAPIPAPPAPGPTPPQASIPGV